MRSHALLGTVLLFSAISLRCGSGNATLSGGGNQTAALTVSTSAAQNGAVIVTLASTTAGANLYYTVDGSMPTASSAQYQAPFLRHNNVSYRSWQWRGERQSL